MTQVVSGESGGEKENTEENTIDQHPVFGGRHNDAEVEKEQNKLLRAISEQGFDLDGGATGVRDMNTVAAAMSSGGSGSSGARYSSYVL